MNTFGNMAHPIVTSDPIFRYGISKFQIKADLSSFFIAFEAKSVVALVVFTKEQSSKIIRKSVYLCFLYSFEFLLPIEFLVPLVWTLSKFVIF